MSDINDSATLNEEPIVEEQVDQQDDFADDDFVAPEKEIETEVAAVKAEPISRREQLVKAMDKIDPAKDAEKPLASVKQPEQLKAAPTTAPQSWKNDAKALFGQLPPAVQAEVQRRETEIARKLSETDQERQIAQKFIKTTQPFYEQFKRLNVDPYTATERALQISTVLNTGNPQEKARMAAHIIQQFGIDIETLDDLLASGQTQQQARGMDPIIEQKLAKVEEFINSQQQERHQQQVAEVNKTIEGFAKNPKNVHFWDVKDKMVELINAKQASTLEEAYEQACWLNTDVRKRILADQNANRMRQTAGRVSLNNSGPNGAAGLSPLNAKGKSRAEIMRSIWKDEE